MSRVATRLLAVLVPVALLAPVAAHAEKVVTEDPAGDVVVLSSSDEAAEFVVTDYAGVDVLRTVAAHGTKRLRVVVHFRALRADPFQFTMVRVRTPRGTYDLVVERLGGTPVTQLVRGREDVDCRGLKAQADRRADTVTVGLPTSCIDAPRWVRLAVGAVALDADVANGASYADDAHRAGGIRDAIAWGPTVRRG